MPLKQTLTSTANDGKAMTIVEIAQFVEDAKAAGAPGDTVVDVTASMGGKIKKLEMTFTAERSGQGA
jgi:hypothetical protein